MIFIISIISNILFLHSTTFAEVISVNTTISTDTTYSSLTVTN
ncbi:MAG: hypothetical protein Q8M44_01505 [bacterium]|nr:hypothetical protein [bacterium]